MNWIPVTETLPDFDTRVLVYGKEKNPAFAEHDPNPMLIAHIHAITKNGPIWRHDAWGNIEFTHWMPLPEPPHAE